MSENKIITGALSKGTVIKSPRYEYRVEKVLGAGGFGITYMVTRVSDGTVFALKEYFPSTLCERGEVGKVTYLKTNALKFEEGVRDFITEAKRLDKQNISHPNLISVEEVFKANDTAYYIMEYVDGATLRQYIKKQHNRPLTLEQALSVMRPILQAVALIHKKRLTHYDIKHDNILLTEEEDGSLRPVLIDFGQAKHYDKKGDATSTLTNAGCSDGFSPQEQYAGLPKFTPQADVYAICATMLYLLTAKVPPKASDISTMSILSLLGDLIPPRVKDALVNGLRKDKDDRTQTVEKLAEDLGLDITTQTQDGSVTRLLNIHRHRKFDYSRFIIPAAGIAVVAAIVGGAVYWYSNSPQPTQSDLLTKAIAAGDMDELKRFADLESIRAYAPYSELLIRRKDYDGGILYAEKALSSPDSIMARNLLDTAQRLIAKNSGLHSENQVLAEDERVENSEEGRNSQEDNLTPIETNDERFLRAHRENNFNELLLLARSNFAKAYYPVALSYYNRGNNKQAEVWAKKAISSNVNKKEAIALIDKIYPLKQEDVSAQENHTLTDDELFAKATTIEELQALADKGYAKAFVPLAERYSLSKNYAKANTYARKALSANISDIERQKAMLIIEVLRQAGAYDNGENGGEPNY